jgi:nitrogen fixation NifU-like protein
LIAKIAHFLKKKNPFTSNTTQNSSRKSRKMESKIEYSQRVLEHFRNPQNVGRMDDADGFGEIGNPECGDVVKIYLKVSPDHKIEQISFQAFGCAAAIACSSMTTMLAAGKSLDEAGKITKYDVAAALGGLPPRKMHCSNLGADALQLAIRNYKENHNLPQPSDPIETQMQQIREKIDPNVPLQEYSLDLRGKECPMTFVYTKVALETIPARHVLHIILSFPPSFQNVPASVEKQNLGKIIHKHEKDGILELWIKKI